MNFVLMYIALGCVMALVIQFSGKRDLYYTPWYYPILDVFLWPVHVCDIIRSKFK